MKTISHRQGDVSEARCVHQLQKSSFCIAHGPANNLTPRPCSCKELSGPSTQTDTKVGGVFGRSGRFRGSERRIRSKLGVSVIVICYIHG